MDYGYEIGDRVRIKDKKDIQPSWDYDEGSMGKYCGKLTTVLYRQKDKDGKVFYNLDEDNGRYLWTEDMLIKANGCSMLADLIAQTKSDIPEITFDKGMFLWNLFSLTGDSGLGEITGITSFDFDGDEFVLTADLEGNRELYMDVRRK